MLVMIVPSRRPASTFTTSVKTALADAERWRFEQVIVPVPPTAGVVHDQPPGVDERDERRVRRAPCRRARRVAALLGPALVDRDGVGEVRAGSDRIGRVGLRDRQVGRRGDGRRRSVALVAARSDRSSPRRRVAVLDEDRAGGDRRIDVHDEREDSRPSTPKLGFVQETVPVAADGRRGARPAGPVVDERHERRAGRQRVGEARAGRVARAVVREGDRVSEVAAGVDRIGRVGLA